MIALFVLKLFVGITMMWWLMPRKDVTDGFFRIQMGLLLGLAVLSVLLLSADQTWIESTSNVGQAVSASNIVNVDSSDAANLPQSSESALIGESSAQRVAANVRWIAIAVAVISYAGSIFWALGRRLPGNICIHLLTGLSVLAMSLHAFQVPNEGSVAMQLLSDFSTAALLGSVLTGMLLGHWYLTTPTMSINPLWWFNKAILVAAVVRLGCSLWAVGEFGVASESTQQIWLGIRWVGGIIAPMIMTVVVWRILKHRNTQSATGVLFAGLILVFMGEMTATLLERDTLIPY